MTAFLTSFSAWTTTPTSGTHGHELAALTAEIRLNQLLGVVDDTHGGNGEQPQMRADQQGLGVRVADAADAAGAVEFGHVLLELGLRRVFGA